VQVRLGGADSAARLQALVDAQQAVSKCLGTWFLSVSAQWIAAGALLWSDCLLGVVICVVCCSLFTPTVAGIEQRQALKRHIDGLQQPLLALEQALLSSNGSGSNVE
jgi:hypothetical protein